MKKTGRHTFVIDGNYFLFRTLYVIPSRSKKAGLLGTDEDVQTFVKKLATDFAYQIRLFEGLIDKVVWTVDSRSWRKDFYPEAEYKVTVNKMTLLTGRTFQKQQLTLFLSYLSKVLSFLKLTALKVMI